MSTRTQQPALFADPKPPAAKPRKPRLYELLIKPCPHGGNDAGIMASPVDCSECNHAALDCAVDWSRQHGPRLGMDRRLWDPPNPGYCPTCGAYHWPFMGCPRVGR